MKKFGTHLLTLSYLAHFGREMVMTTEIVTYPNQKCLVGVCFSCLLQGLNVQSFSHTMDYTGKFIIEPGKKKKPAFPV